MTERITLALVSIACLTATVLPRSVEREVVTVRVPAPKPAMWLECTEQMRSEINAICKNKRRHL
jgi:hypothetical protein